MKFIDFQKQMKEEGEISPVYLAEGEEAYFRDRVVEVLRERCIQQPTLNDVRLEGDTLKGDRLFSFRDELYALPFLSEKRMIRVYEWYPTEKEFESVLKGYLAKPCPSTVLLIVNSGKKPTGRTDLKRKGGINCIDCSHESEEVLCKWLYGMFRRAGLNSDVDAVQQMVRYCSCDCARMKTEIEKLALLLGKGGSVTREVVDEYIYKDVDYKIYELTQAAAQRNFTQFSMIWADLKQKGLDENALLASLTSHYRNLYDVSTVKGSDADTAKALGIKQPYAVKKNREAAARLGRERVKEYYLALYDLSCSVKSGLCGKEGAAFAGIAKIFFDS